MPNDAVAHPPYEPRTSEPGNIELPDGSWISTDRATHEDMIEALALQTHRLQQLEAACTELFNESLNKWQRGILETTDVRPVAGEPSVPHLTVPVPALQNLRDIWINRP